MNKKIVHEYTFDASAQTVVSSDFNRLRDIAIITNITDGVVIYDALEPTLGGTLSGKTLTLEYNTTSMSDTDELQIITHTGTDIDRIGFAKAISNNIDTDMFTLLQTGSGMTVNQSAGNLVVTTGTTARSETIIRGLNSYSGGIRARIQSILSQRIVNQQFFFELVDVVGDSLAYTINSATSITVTLPASFGLSAQNIGQSMTLQGFSGTGTFLSGRYPIASVSGNDATFTVSGFAAGTGTLSAVGWNFYRLEYSGTTATNGLFDTARNGYASGNTTATINTTASPGHMAIITGNDGQASLLDQLIASSAAIQTANRATRVVMVPDDAQVYLQIRVLNGSSAPASGTTWTIGQVSVGHFEAESVIVQDLRPTGFQTALPVEVMRSSTNAVTISSGTVTTVTNITNQGMGADDSAFTVGTTRVMPSGFLIDETATDSGDEGDMIAARATADRKQIITPYVHAAAGGWTPYKSLDLDETEEEVKATAGKIGWIHVMNMSASVRYLKIYNATAASVTVGTTTPVFTFPIPTFASTNGAGFTISFGDAGTQFSTAICIAATTGLADNDTGAPGANEVVINLGYL